MTETEHRFCPRCGTALAAGMPFCPKCGLDTSDVAEATGEATAAATEPPGVPDRESAAPAPEPDRPFAVRARRVPAVVVAGLLVMIGLIAFGLLTRPQGAPAGGSPGQGGTGATTAPSALLVGLTILSPTDGQLVAAKDVLVIGTAPPGVTITQDISFGLDQHTTVDGTGHWAIKVGLNAGENKLTFRIGDDSSTKKEIHVVYTPPS